MKILKYPDNKKWKKEITCCCGAKLEIEESDIKLVSLFNELTEYIICPCCYKTDYIDYCEVPRELHEKLLKEYNDNR